MDETTINAACAVLDESLVRAALAACVKHYRMMPVRAVCHPAQSFSWDFFTVTKIFEDNADTPLVRDVPNTICGIPVAEDVRISVDLIEFRDADDKVVASIKNLAVPVAFQQANLRS